MPRQAMDYSKTIIYKIVCNDLEILETYIGHTTNIIKRRNNHKSNCNDENGKSYNLKIYQTIRANKGWDNWSVIQICEFPCNNQEEARAEERRHYEMLNASLNMINPCRGKKEYCEINKETIAEKSKEYHTANRDTILEKFREYYDVNKDTILERCKEYYDVNKDTILEKHKEYYEANKDKIAKRGKIKYTCCCGSTIRKYDKAKHEKTQKHLNYIKCNPLVAGTL